MVGITFSPLALFARKGAGQGIGQGIGSSLKETMDQARQVTQLLNRSAATRMGIVPGEIKGDYTPVYRVNTEKTEEAVYEERDVEKVSPVYGYRDRTETRDVYEERDLTEIRDVTETRTLYETRDVTESRDVFEDRDITETRDITEDRTIYETRDITEMRDITELRDILETRDIYETRNVYETRDIRATEVKGGRDLRPYNTLAQAGIDVGADFSIKVGNGSTAVFRFDQSQRLSVTQNGATQRFNFTSAVGSMRAAVVSALSSVNGLNASIDANGRLALSTDNAQSVTISDVANGLLDFSGSPLNNLGLVAGTTHSTVVGQEQVLTGTEQVIVGSQQVAVGQESVVVGQETIVIGTEQVAVGTEQIVVGSETVVIGSERVLIGQETIVTGTETFAAGTEDVVIGTQTVVIGSERVRVGEETVVTGIERFQTGEKRTVTGRAQVQVGTMEREMVTGFEIVGLENKSHFGGLGDQLLLKRLLEISSGASDILKLFERDAPEAESRGEAKSFAHVRAAYGDSEPREAKGPKLA